MNFYDMVLVHDDDIKRGKWLFIRVFQVMQGKDRVVRVAKIKTKNGVYTRPTANVPRLVDAKRWCFSREGEMLVKWFANRKYSCVRNFRCYY